MGCEHGTIRYSLANILGCDDAIFAAWYAGLYGGRCVGVEDGAGISVGAHERNFTSTELNFSVNIHEVFGVVLDAEDHPTTVARGA